MAMERRLADRAALNELWGKLLELRGSDRRQRRAADYPRLCLEA